MMLRACPWLLALALACSSSSTSSDAATADDAGPDATTGGHSGAPGDGSTDAALDGASSGHGGGGSGGNAGSGGSGGSDDGGPRDASESDASQPAHRCYVDGCNGDLDAIASAPGCPERKPELSSRCALPNGAECFYCEPGEDRLSPSDAIPTLVCSNGTWTYDELFSACD